MTEFTKWPVNDLVYVQQSVYDKIASICVLCCLRSDWKLTKKNNNNNRFTALCPGLPGWAGTRRNIHPPTILIIIQPLSASSSYYDPQHPPCSDYVLGHLFAQPLSTSFLVWSNSWSGALHLIFHTFLHPISVFFSQHMTIPSHPALL